MKPRTSWVLVALFAVAAVASSGERQAASYVPADCWLTVCWDGSPPGMDETALHKFLAEPEMKAALAQFQPLLDLLSAQMQEDVGIDFGPALVAMLRGQVAFGLGAPKAGAGDPSVVVAVQLGGAGDPARAALERLFQETREKAKPDSIKALAVGEVKGTALVDKDGDPHHFAFHGGYLIDASTEALFRKAVAGEGRELPAERALLRVRYDHQAMRKHFAEQIGGDPQAMLEALGINAIRSAEVAMVPRAKRLVTEVTVDMPDAAKAGGVAKWFSDPTPVDRELLKRVPKNTTMFIASSMDLGGLWDSIWETAAKANPRETEQARAGLAEFEGKLGFKLRERFLGSLDRGTLLMSTPGLAGALGSSGVIVQRVKDAKALEQALTQLVNRLDLLLMDQVRGPMGAVRTELRPFKYRGHTCRYLWLMGAPALMLLGWAPCYAIVGDAVVFARHPLDLKDYLDFVADKGPTILENADFRKLEPLVPKGASMISYGEWSEAFISLYNTFAPFAQLAQGFPKQMELPQALDLANMPSSRLLRRYSRGTIAYGGYADGRYRVAFQGDGVTFLSPHMAPTATVAILAGMLLPALARARGEARLIRDRNNLNQIARGCATYLNEHGDNRRYPTSLAELVEKGVMPDRNVFISPLDPNPPELKKGFRCSYVSCFERHPKRQFLDDFPPNIIMAWDREPFLVGRRNVLFFDSHVEVMDEERFQENLRLLDEQVKRQTKERKPATDF